MRLSDLKPGQTGVITKVLGHGAFRKRVMEMGFVRGREVNVVLNAPLQDPVKYALMGYEVSLRRAEADLIEIETSSNGKTRLLKMLIPIIPNRRKKWRIQGSAATK